MITHDKIDLIMKVAKMCARKAGLPEQDVISMGALKHALTIYCNLPEPGTVGCDLAHEFVLGFIFCSTRFSS